MASFFTFSRAFTFYFAFILGVCPRGASWSFHFCFFFGPLDATGAIQGLQTVLKTNVFLTFQKSLRGPLERLLATQRVSQGAPFGLGARPRGAFGRPEIPDRTPWAPRWGPGGGEQGLWRNQTRIYSGQGFQNKKTLPVAATDTFLGKCCCGCREKQYFVLRKLDPPRSDPPKDSPKDPPRTQRREPKSLPVVTRAAPTTMTAYI